MRSGAESAPVGSERSPSPRTQRSAGGDRHPTPAELVIERWADPLLDGSGHPATGFYVERYWGPIIGPSSLLLVRALVRRLETDTQGFDVATADLAAMIGCSSNAGVTSQFWKTVRRAQRFGLVRQVDDRLFVRSELGPLTTRLSGRLPPHLRDEHRLWERCTTQPDAEITPPPAIGDATSSLGVLRLAARGLCTAEELRSLDRQRRLS